MAQRILKIQLLNTLEQIFTWTSSSDFGFILTKKTEKYSKFFRNCVESILQYMLRLLTVHRHFSI